MWSRWVAFGERQELATSLAVFRMLIAASALLTVGWVWVGGLVPSLWVDQAYGGIHTLRGTPLVNLFGGPTPAVTTSVLVACCLSASALLLGFGGRLTAFATLQLTLALVRLNPFVSAAYDTLLANGLWLCVLAPTTTTWSVDARIREGTWSSPRLVGVWGRYLVVFQLVVMYTSTGWQKLSESWVPGGDFSALYYILQMPNFQYRNMEWVAPMFWMTQVGTAVSWTWEVTGPVLLIAVWASDHGMKKGVFGWLVRWRVREVYAAIGLVMHGVLLVTMELGPFGFTSLAFYPALVHPREWARLTARNTARTARPVADPPASA